MTDETMLGCQTHGCVIASPVGMATNGPCRCDAIQLRRAVLRLRVRERQLLAAATALLNEYDAQLPTMGLTRKEWPLRQALRAAIAGEEEK